MYNVYTLLKSERRNHMSRCHGSHECWFTHRQFHSQFHSRRHSLRITLKYTTLVRMRISNAWIMKPWLRSEWRLGFILFFRGDCEKDISSDARQNDMNTPIVLPGTHHSPRRSHLKSWSSSIYRKFIFCMFYLLKYHTKQDFVFKYHMMQILYSQC